MSIEQIKSNSINILIEQVAPNIILNRFDLLYGDNFELYLVNGEYIPVYIEKRRSPKHIGPFRLEMRTAKLGIYLRDIQTNNLLELGCFLREKYKLHYIEILHTYTKIPGIESASHWHIELSETIEQFNARLNSSVRYNTKWYPKKLKKDFGEYTIMRYKPHEIPDGIIEQYLEWKSKRFKYQFSGSGDEFMRQRGITDIFVMSFNRSLNTPPPPPPPCVYHERIC